MLLWEAGVSHLSPGCSDRDHSVAMENLCVFGCQKMANVLAELRLG